MYGGLTPKVLSLSQRRQIPDGPIGPWWIPLPVCSFLHQLRGLGQYSDLKDGTPDRKSNKVEKMFLCIYCSPPLAPQL